MHNSHMDTGWFAARKKALKITDAQIATAIGRERSVVNKMLNGRSAIDARNAGKLAELFQVDQSEILVRAGIIESQSDRPPPNAVVVPLEGPSTERMRDDLPIYGTALGAEWAIEGEAIEQTTLNRAEVVGYVKRPVLLNGNASAYGLYVAGSSMEPRYMDGELVLADPKGRVRSNDDVVVYLRTDIEEDDNGEASRGVMVKRLVRRSATFIELQQFTPAKTFRIATSDVTRIDRVIPLSELLA